MSHDRRDVGWALLVFVAVGALTAWLHWPGHLSVDSIVQLYEGVTGRYESFNPPAMSFVLSLAYWLTGGTGLFLLLNFSLFFCAVWLLFSSVCASARSAALATALVSLWPVVLAYNGIIWKDVFFANLALAAFALATRAYATQRTAPLLFAWLLAGLAGSVRQQGLAIAPALGVLLLLQLLDGRSRVTPRAASVALAASAAFAAGLLGPKPLISLSAESMQSAPYSTAIQLLKRYDLIGIARNTPDWDYARLREVEGYDEDDFRVFLSAYTPERIDALDYDNPLPYSPFDRIPWETIDAQWGDAVTQHPVAYASHRLDVLAWQLGFHDVERCLPLYLGIGDTPAEFVAELGLTPRVTERWRWFWGVQTHLFDLLYRPFAYLLGSGVLIALYAWRGLRAHAPFIALQTAGLLYASTYTLIGLACDFRYVYFSVAVAVVGGVHVCWMGLGLAERPGTPGAGLAPGSDRVP